MTSLLASALFPESPPSELAEVAHELGYDGIDLEVRGHPDADDERTLALLAAEGAPALLLSVDSHDAPTLRPWCALAKAAGCAALRLHPLPEDGVAPALVVARLAELAADSDVRLLVPNHAGSPLSTPEPLAELLDGLDPGRVAALLAPDQIPRSRAGDHVAWLGRMKLPPIGAVCLGGYRWEAQIGAGNIRLWSAVPTLIGQSLTPWPAWLQRLRELGFDGLFTCGDASLPAGAAERLRLARDDLRFLKRHWLPRA
jgi:sugar phosphate isomerase/epimerase